MATKRDFEKLERLKYMLDRGRPESGPPHGLPPERAQKWILHFNIEHVHGPEEVDYGPDELVVVCNVRDGRPYVKSFVEHYTSMGVKHMVFLDNGSTDGTVEALKSYDNVTVLRTTLPFKRYKVSIKQYLMERFGRERWSLCADIDELFDYPYSDVVGLDSLLRYLTERSYTAVAAQMLDMFPEEPLSEAASEEDEPLKERHRLYDISNMGKESYSSVIVGARDHWIHRNAGYEISQIRAWDHWAAKNEPRGHWCFRRACGTGNVLANGDIQVYKDGIQNTVFGGGPPLTKHPLVFIDEKVKPMDISMHSVSEARIADLTCVLLHHKFLNHFYEVARRAVRQGRYGNKRYEEFLAVLEKNPELSVKGEHARELRSVNNLVENGFLIVSEDYMELVYKEEEKRKDAHRVARGGPRGLEAEAPYRIRAEAKIQRLRARRLEQRVEELREQQVRQEENLRKANQKRKEFLSTLTKERSKARSLEKQNRHLQKQNRHLQKQNRNLTRRLQSIQASRFWRLLSKLGRLRARALGKRWR